MLSFAPSTMFICLHKDSRLILLALLKSSQLHHLSVAFSTLATVTLEDTKTF